jgi:hypothetical protein
MLEGHSRIGNTEGRSSLVLLISCWSSSSQESQLRSSQSAERTATRSRSGGE